MVLFFQHTLTDIRCLTKADAGLLSRPAWPSPSPFSDFMRGSGQIIPRGKMGLDNWIGENFICKIRRGLKVGPATLVSNKNIQFRNVARHQYSSEHFILTKYEFVFATKKEFSVIDYKTIETIVQTLFQTEVFIRNETFGYTKTIFQHLHEHLKRFHILNSTFKKEINFEKQLPFIKSCTPQVYIALDKNETVSTNGKKIPSVTGNDAFPFKLYGFWYNYLSHPLRVWIYERKAETTMPDVGRSLRISILRLHSEFECLNNIFKAINKDEIDVEPYSKQSDILQAYLNKAISTVLEDEASVNKRNEATDSVSYFRKVFSQLQPGELNSLSVKIKNFKFRPQVEKKTINYINNYKTNVMGDNFNVTGSQVGAMGANAKAENNTFNQVSHNIPADLDYAKLEQELTALKDRLKSSAESAEEFEAVKNVAQAEGEAKKKNGNGVVQFLKAGGKWVLDTATEIGSKIVVELLKKNMSLG